jgi:hypothetical protein
MKRNLMLVCLSASLCTAAMFARVASAQEPTADATASTSPVAIVYVAFTPKDSSTNAIMEYSADSAGKLTELPGSPFIGNVTTLAVNGKYLFAPNKTEPYIESYRIESNGTLHWVEETNYTTHDEGANAISVSLDHTGADVYLSEIDSSENVSQQSYAVNKSSGKLSYLGIAGAGSGSFEGAEGPPIFDSKNAYAYVVDFNGMYYGTFAFKRNSNGLLTTVGENNIAGSGFTLKVPAGPPDGTYVPFQIATDPTNHAAIAMQAFNSNDFPEEIAIGNPQIGSFTEASNGSLSSSNTYANMPKTAVTEVGVLSMSPSGKLLAVGGTGGLQVFHFNEASPVTAYTGLLTTATITAAYWDNSNHLYAISPSGKLFVFTVTTTSHSEASGSPHAISSPVALIVQPSPWY